MKGKKEVKFKVQVHLLTQSQPISMYDVRDSYQKGSLFCVMFMDGTVRKFPIDHIFDIVETYYE